MIPPRSVYIAFEVFPRPKGASSHIAAMVTSLARRHGPVWLLCLGFAEMPARQVEGDICIYRYKLHHPNMLRRTEGFGEFVYRLLSLQQVNPELLVFRDPWGGWPALQALPQTPALFEVNGLPSWELPYTYPALEFNAALRAKIRDLELFCLNAAAAVLTVSGLTCEALAGLGVDPAKIFVIPNSAADIFFQASGAPSPLEILNTGRWFGYCGSLHPWQGVEMLVAAWHRVACEWPDVRLLIITSGQRESLRNLRRQIRKCGSTGRVVVHSPLAPKLLAEVMAKLEFTCAPLMETFRNTAQGCCPIKIVESMAAGTPVLAADLRIARDLISPGRDGVLARAGGVRSWALAIHNLLQDESYRRRLSRGAKETAGKHFSSQVMSDNIEKVCRAVLSSKNTSPDKSTCFRYPIHSNSG